MDLKFIQHVYNQWAHGHNAAARWWEFIEMISRMNKVNTQDLAKELEKCAWFKRGE